MVETTFTVFMNIGAWNAYGPGWGDLTTLEYIDWSWKPLAELNSLREYVFAILQLYAETTYGTVAVMAQSFYVWRIYRLTKSIWLPVLIQCVRLTVTLVFPVPLAHVW